MIVLWMAFEMIVYACLGVSKGRLKWWVVLLMLAGVIGLGLLALWIQHTVMWWIAGGGVFVFYAVLILSTSDDPMGLKRDD